MDNNDLSFTISKPIRLVCRSWFYPIEIDNYSLRLIAPHINCSVVFYLGEGDAKYQTITIRLIRNVTISLLSDYFTIICEDPKKKHFYPSLPYASIHYNSTILKRLSKRNKRKEDHFNIVIVGLDSVSRLQFERMLPLTFDYITNTMNGIVLKGRLIYLKQKDRKRLEQNNRLSLFFFLGSLSKTKTIFSIKACNKRKNMFEKLKDAL